MEPVLLQRLTLNDVVLGENLPFRLCGTKVYHVEKVFPYHAIFHLIFTPPVDYGPVCVALQQAHDAQELITLSLHMTGDAPHLWFIGYLIWWHLSCPEERDDAPHEIELEIAMSINIPQPRSALGHRQ